MYVIIIVTMNKNIYHDDVEDIEFLKACTKSFFVRLPNGQECYISNRNLFYLLHGMRLANFEVRHIVFPENKHQNWLCTKGENNPTGLDIRNFNKRKR